MKQIQWYPGHMAKTKREIKEKVKLVDVVLELVDARIPFSSQNPSVGDMIGSTPRVILFNKADLADTAELQKWIEMYQDQGIPSLRIDAAKNRGVHQILPLIKSLLQDVIEKEKQRGRKERPLRTMILGIPNVGKSTLINTLAGKKKLVVSDRPGVTRQTQYIRVGTDFELLDTPGILWPKFDDEEIAVKLALTGAIKDQILPKDDVTIAGFRYLNRYYKGRLEERYDVDVDIDNIVQLFDDIGLKRGCLLPGREIDYDRVCDIVLHDLRHGRLGKITLDRVEELVSV
ncbi:ribosome biogenesis GTPase YlqF [Candidatus Xianfuyuplasma coldseepsis]|uniref:Ribosome biogenesis GTPase A n=1 Tax=Candidatus Xianfuyuplasma coldseepsis TaxID=2782163 RepID=A0A7L7KTU1_9MOLU|nr:ribosome biogenesis GTPase YlqF [Xianfuyuplasma coldseepsis]QMS85414.1 ribosome biogenesis GTPase YlqF [Xianfuyuplasma coldseepsis]